MLLKNKKSYNHLLIELKKKENITAEKLAELANVSVATLNSWLANPNTKKWRRLDKDRYYYIKAKLYFSSQNSFDKKDNIRTFLHHIDIALNIAHKSAVTGQSIPKEELQFIKQAKEMNQLIVSSIFDLIPTDEEEKNLIKSLMEEHDSEQISAEEEFYLEFLASINKKEVLELHYQEKQSPFIIAKTLKFPTRLIERLIREDEEENIKTLELMRTHAIS
ncbi:hypothetical protein [Legionella sp. WA2022007384]